MKEGVVVLDNHGIINYVNEQFCSLVNYKTDDILGRPLTDFMDSANKDVFIKQSGSDSHDEHSSYEIYLHTKNGLGIPTIISPGYMTDDSSRITGRFAVFTNIYRQKVAEEFLRVQRDLSLILSATTDMKVSFKAILDALLKLSGMDNGSIFLANDEIGGMDLVYYEGVSEEFAKFYSHLEPDMFLLQKIKSGKSEYSNHKEIGFQVEDILRRESLLSFMSVPIMHDEKLLAVLNLGSHALNEFPEGVKTVIETIALQIGEVFKRIKSEQNLFKERCALENIISLNPYCIIVFDSKARFVRANKAFKKLFGFMPSEDYSLIEDIFIKRKGFLDNIHQIMEGEIKREEEIHVNIRELADGSEDRDICFSSTTFPIFSMAALAAFTKA